MNLLPPSGRQVTIAHGRQQAVIVEVGAALRRYAVDGDDIVDGFAADEMSTGGRGQVLAPWPNRLDGGSYDFDGRVLQLPLSEPHAGNAIHGLVRFANWEVAESGSAHAVMTHRLHPQPGYPFLLDLRVAYALDAAGLTVVVEATNRGPDRCPFGAGAHPYVRVGERGVDPLTLRSPAASWYRSDGRGIPVERCRCEGTPNDFREPRAIGAARLDTAFTDLQRGTDGRAVVELAAPDGGRRVQVWMDPSFTHLMLFTGDTLAGDARRRSLAVEPMSCAPNAFRTGDGLRVLAPGETFRGRWGIVPFPC